MYQMVKHKRRPHHGQCTSPSAGVTLVFVNSKLLLKKKFWFIPELRWFCHVVRAVAV